MWIFQYHYTKFILLCSEIMSKRQKGSFVRCKHNFWDWQWISERCMTTTWCRIFYWFSWHASCNMPPELALEDLILRWNLCVQDDSAHQNIATAIMQNRQKRRMVVIPRWLWLARLTKQVFCKFLKIFLTWNWAWYSIFRWLSLVNAQFSSIDPSLYSRLSARKM